MFNKNWVRKHPILCNSQKVKYYIGEKSPQCQFHFSIVMELIQLMEGFHASGPLKELCDVYPKCGKAFHDLITSVNHVEKDHGHKSQIFNLVQHLGVNLRNFLLYVECGIYFTVRILDQGLKQNQMKSWVWRKLLHGS